MLEFVIGEKRNPIAADSLLELLEGYKEHLTGTLYVGYPILGSPDETLLIDALLITLEHGLIIIDLQRTDDISTRYDDLYAAMLRRLMGFKELRSGRDLATEISVIGFKPSNGGDSEQVFTPDTLIEYLETLPGIDSEMHRALNAAIERTTTIRPPKKRVQVKKANSRGSVLKEIEKNIANLDAWQKRAAIEMPDGPQRIRGLAGSGKTIVLALKASYLHTSKPDWNIVITFQSRALYPQFQDLVRRFTFESTLDEPNWEKLLIMHAWGSGRKAGVYSEIAKRAGVAPRTFGSARQDYGSLNAFEGVCKELLDFVDENPIEPLFDVVLIDEAQDFPQPFFELAIQSVREKRVAWAYDELQNLTKYKNMAVSELFGADSNDHPRISELRNDYGSPRQDIVLPICYRNTPWALTTAHALGLGIYRTPQLVQFFTDEYLWKEIGYEVVHGAIAPGHDVSIRRRRDSYPPYFSEYLNPDDAVATKSFENREDQADWVAEEIRKNLYEEELEFSDILIILPNPITVSQEASFVIKALQKKEIPSHIVGVTSSVDEIFSEESVAISGIYRAKGNEAAMVYVLNSDYCADGFELSRLRNILFTAITRSRAWVRICGVGERMEIIENEVQKVIDNNFQLTFRVPSEEELAHIRKIHSELTEEDRQKAKALEKKAAEFFDLITEFSPENLPESLRKQFEQLFGKKE